MIPPLCPQVKAGHSPRARICWVNCYLSKNLSHLNRPG